MRQRPTAALLELDDPFNGWIPTDYRLQEAVTTLNREKCQTCGNPVWLCHSNSNEIDFVIKKGACYAKAEIDDFEKLHKDDLESFEYYYAEAVGIENEDGTRDPLPSRYKAYMAMADD